MTAPWDDLTPPPATGWWVRKDRVGRAEGEYEFAGTAEGKKYPKGTASGGYLFAGSAAGVRGPFDDFNRTNNTLNLGSAQWVARQNVMGINSNAAYPVTSGAASYATWANAMNGDDMYVEVTMGAGQGSGDKDMYLVLGANTTGQCLVLNIDRNNSQLFLFYKSSWASGLTANGGSGSHTISTGDVISFQRVGATMTTRQNGNVIDSSDDTQNCPRDSSHRLVGIGGYNVGGSVYDRFDRFYCATL